MIPRSQRSTLFPYTTLFRSRRPFSDACERNREPILAVLREHFGDRRRVLEIGSGTGQHAVYFGAALPHLEWQTADRKSTRLNSSHSQISYAVFCLKKKIK